MSDRARARGVERGWNKNDTICTYIFTGSLESKRASEETPVDVKEQQKNEPERKVERKAMAQLIAFFEMRIAPWVIC